LFVCECLPDALIKNEARSILFWLFEMAPGFIFFFAFCIRIHYHNSIISNEHADKWRIVQATEPGAYFSEGTMNCRDCFLVVIFSATAQSLVQLFNKAIRIH